MRDTLLYFLALAFVQLAPAIIILGVPALLIALVWVVTALW